MSLWKALVGKVKRFSKKVKGRECPPRRVCLSCGNQMDPLVGRCPSCGRSQTALIAGDDKEALLQAILDQERAAEHSRRGMEFLADGKLDYAESEARRALEISPNQTLAHSNLGIILLQQMRVTEAVECFRCALELNPHNETASRYLKRLES